MEDMLLSFSYLLPMTELIQTEAEVSGRSVHVRLDKWLTKRCNPIHHHRLLRELELKCSC